MLRHETLKLDALEAGDHLVLPDATLSHRALQQIMREDQHTLAGVHENVLGVSGKRDGGVARNRPRGGRPDKEAHRPLGRIVHGQLGGFGQFEGHVDGRGGPCLVLDLVLRQSGLAVVAPVDRAQGAIDQIVESDPAERLDLPGLVLRRQRQVGVVPVTAHADALELLALRVNVAQSKLAAEPAPLEDRDLVAHDAPVLLHALLGRQALSVPAGDVGAVEAAHRHVLDRDVLEDLVQCLSQMDVSIGIWGPVMEHKFGCTMAMFAYPPVNVHLLP